MWFYLLISTHAVQQVGPFKSQAICEIVRDITNKESIEIWKNKYIGGWSQ